MAAEQQRHGEPAEAVHNPRPERYVVKSRLVVQERVPEAPGQDPVGCDLVTDHDAFAYFAHRLPAAFLAISDRATMMAAPITSPGRFSPLGPLGICFLRIENAPQAPPQGTYP